MLANLIHFDNISIFPSPEFGYRNRMEFLFLRSGLGLRQKDAPGKTLPIKKCEICTPRINHLLSELNESFTMNPDALRYAVIRSTSSSDSVSLVLKDNSKDLKQAIEKNRAYLQTSSASNILVTYTSPDEDEQTSSDFFVLKGEPFLKEQLSGMTFTFSAQGFFQNNTYIANKLHEYVTMLFNNYDTKNSALLDLYAGVGTFGIINSKLFSKVYIVESFPGCTASAEHNIKLNNIKNANISTLDARSIGRLSIDKDCYVITDPPRSGMDEKAIEQIKHLKPKAIIYISCNPHQLAKDLKKFKSYTLSSLALFDMFPQTQHMEAVAELRLIE
jgi:23S rRNA (uracil1939-C5)-methyltransferase